MNKTLFKEYSSLNNNTPFIYALCDYELLNNKNISIKKFLDICKNLNVKLIQYRDKLNNIKIQKTNLLYLKNNCSIPIIINDKVELLEYCDGIHLGQEDLQNISKKIYNN